MEKVERIEEKVESSVANVEAIHRKVEQIAGKEESAEFISNEPLPKLTKKFKPYI